MTPPLDSRPQRRCRVTRASILAVRQALDTVLSRGGEPVSAAWIGRMWAQAHPSRHAGRVAIRAVNGMLADGLIAQVGDDAYQITRRGIWGTTQRVHVQFGRDPATVGPFNWDTVACLAAVLGPARVVDVPGSAG